jgi:hypothetical protein
MTTSLTLHLPRIPKPFVGLEEFSPFIDWALRPVHSKARLLGVDFGDRLVRNVLLTDRTTVSNTPDLNQNSSISNEDFVGIDAVQHVVEQIGWLTWEDYCYLVVAVTYGGVGGALSLYSWTKDGKRLQTKLRFLKALLLRPKVMPFAPVLKKVIKRYLWEVEMRKKYPEAVCRRYRDFESSGTTLDFNEQDLERDDKARREEAQQANGENSTSTGQDVESKSVSSEAPKNGTSTDISETSLLETASIDESATK